MRALNPYRYSVCISKFLCNKAAKIDLLTMIVPCGQSTYMNSGELSDDKYDKCNSE